MTTNSTTPLLHVVGKKPDGSYEVFTMFDVPDGEGIDAAEIACNMRRLRYVECSRAK